MKFPQRPCSRAPRDICLVLLCCALFYSVEAVSNWYYAPSGSYYPYATYAPAPVVSTYRASSFGWNTGRVTVPTFGLGFVNQASTALNERPDYVDTGYVPAYVAESMAYLKRKKRRA